MKILEDIINEIYKRWKPKTKKETQIGIHGSSKGDIDEVTWYYDETEGEWTLKEFAFKGHLIKILNPIIKKIIQGE